MCNYYGSVLIPLIWLMWTEDLQRNETLMLLYLLQVRKDACETFRLIQGYMGDRKIKKSDSVALDIITMGWQKAS